MIAQRSVEAEPKDYSRDSFGACVPFPVPFECMPQHKIDALIQHTLVAEARKDLLPGMRYEIVYEVRGIDEFLHRFEAFIGFLRTPEMDDVADWDASFEAPMHRVSKGLWRKTIQRRIL